MADYKEISGGFEIIVSKALYEREAVFSVAYKYHHKFLITISPEGEHNLKFSVKKKSGQEAPSIQDVENILAEFIDEQLRIDILKRTQAIRDRIYEKAFFPLRGHDE